MSIEKLSSNASLKEVMDEFEKISLMELFELNIIVRKELPLSGENNQICILSDNQSDNIVISSNIADRIDIENRIFFLLSQDIKPNYVNLGNSEKLIKMYFINCTQRINGKESARETYVYKNNVWQKLTEGTFLILSNGIYPNQDITGIFTGTNVKQQITSDNFIKFTDDSYSDQRCFIDTERNIDLTNFTKLVFKVNKTEGHYSGWGDFGVGKSKTGTTLAAKKSITEPIGNQELVVDISKISGLYYIKIALGSNYSGARPSVTLEKVWLE